MRVGRPSAIIVTSLKNVHNVIRRSRKRDPQFGLDGRCYGIANCTSHGGGLNIDGDIHLHHPKHIHYASWRPNGGFGENDITKRNILPTILISFLRIKKMENDRWKNRGRWAYLMHCASFSKFHWVEVMAI